LLSPIASHTFWSLTVRNIPATYLVPANTKELGARYAKLIQRTLTAIAASRGQTGHFDDLHTYVWVKLLEAQLLERFAESRVVSPLVTALEACEVTGVTHGQLTGMIARRRRRGLPYPALVNPNVFGFVPGAGYYSVHALFTLDDILELAPHFRKRGRQIDKRGRLVAGSRPEGELKLLRDVSNATEHEFQNYLLVAVRNHASNYWRGEERRVRREGIVQLVPDASTGWDQSLVDHHIPDPEANTMRRLDVRPVLVDVLGDLRVIGALRALERGEVADPVLGLFKPAELQRVRARLTAAGFSPTRRRRAA
jgi:hypothetical protein